MQVNTLESANFNQETMAAMKKGSDALKTIHGNLCVRCARLRVLRPLLTHQLAVFTIASLQNTRQGGRDDGSDQRAARDCQRDFGGDFKSAQCGHRFGRGKCLLRVFIYLGNSFEYLQDELKNELAELEQDELNDRLAGAERAPTTSLPSMAREERESPP